MDGLRSFGARRPFVAAMAVGLLSAAVACTATDVAPGATASPQVGQATAPVQASTSGSAAASASAPASAPAAASSSPDVAGIELADGAEDRAYLVDVMTRIAEPVLSATAAGELHERLPIHEWEEDRADFTHYEAFARTLAGIAPWLELGPDETAEGQQRAKFIEMAQQALISATDPDSPDYMNFGQVPDVPDQPIVETAYLASALLLAPTQLWDPLTDEQQEAVLDAMRIARDLEPHSHNNNWLLFSALREAAIWRYGDDPQMEPIETAVNTFLDDWYLGDGVYGDGPEFHADYYNSYVIHPMMLQVLAVAEEQGGEIAESEPLALLRGQRYAEILERLIAPDGTFPVIGRSSAYRFAAFYQLSYLALRRQLPDSLDAGAVRSGITAVVRNMVEAPGTFDDEGWLQLGAVGHQPGMTETYNATGSLYVCLTGLVHLGLPPDDPFWTAPSAAWTQARIWAGEDVPRDEALTNAAEDEALDGE